MDNLGTYHLDRGNPDLAARYFVHLLSQADADRRGPLTLYKAALACRLAHDAGHEAQLPGPPGETGAGWIDDRRGVSRTESTAHGGRSSAGRAGCTERLAAVPRRCRAPRGNGNLPLLEPLWTRSTVSSKGESWLIMAVRNQKWANRLDLPGSCPIAVPGRVIYRSHTGIHAVDATTGRNVWDKPAASPLSLDAIAADSGKAVVIRNWLQANYGDAYHFPLEGSALGSLSSDGERIYALEDLAVPPPPDVTLQLLGGGTLPAKWLSDVLVSNRLHHHPAR